MTSVLGAHYLHGVRAPSQLMPGIGKLKVRDEEEDRGNVEVNPAG